MLRRPPAGDVAVGLGRTPLGELGHGLAAAGHGGSQQIGARIAYNEIDMVLFFSDPQSSDLDPDLKYINQMCDQYNIPFATNAATAEILIHGLERGDLDWREIINPSLKPVTV